MAVLHDYFCSEHGIFEGWDAKCPMKICKGEISKVFLKPVAMKSDKTKATDKNLKQLAIDYDMTDIKSTKEGEHQTGYMKRKNKLSDKQFAEATAAMQAQQGQQPRPGDAAIWGGGGAISMKSVLGGQFKSINGESVSVTPNSVGNFQAPKASVVMNDHENLQVKR